MTNCSLTFRRWAGSISILMGIMSSVIILSWVQGSTDHYAVSISNRTKNSLSVGYFPFSKRTPFTGIASGWSHRYGVMVSQIVYTTSGT